MNNDKNLEVTISTRYGTVYVLRGNGEILDGYPASVEGEVSSSPAIGDIDGDGSIDVVVATSTGLGYTAIAAAKTAEQVITVELDTAAQAICRLNPWSQGLFDNPTIEQCIGDSFDAIETIEDKSLNCIIHDPPTFSLAGHLYSRDFYAEMYRVLKAGGRAFHYIGDPKSKSGSRVTAGAIQRLEQVGFSEVRRAPRAFGIVAYKSRV